VAKPYCDIEAEIPRLRRFARALTHDVVAADDLVQDCLTRALGKLHLWEEGTDLRAWLFTILHNQHVNHIRQRVREGTAVRLSEREPLLSHAAHQGRRLELRDLERAIGKLPDAQRSVILLVGLEGMRYDEVAVVLNVPVGTIRSRLSRARESLRRLTDGVPDEENRTARLHGSDHASRHMVAGITETRADPTRTWPPRRTRYATERKQAEATSV
jgi:RNA polymerase sigma-70 factor (ECF subfamily)